MTSLNLVADAIGRPSAVTTAPHASAAQVDVAGDALAQTMTSLNLGAPNGSAAGVVADRFTFEVAPLTAPFYFGGNGEGMGDSDGEDDLDEDDGGAVMREGEDEDEDEALSEFGTPEPEYYTYQYFQTMIWFLLNNGVEDGDHWEGNL